MSLASSVGLISGLNFDDIISRISAVNSRPIFLLQDKQTQLRSQAGALQNINLRLDALLKQIDVLNNPASFQRRVASATSKEFFSASAVNTAPEGSYQVEVKQLAAAGRKAAQGFADLNQTAIAAADTTFQFKLGSNGTLRTIDVAAGSTLQQFRDQLNAAGFGVRASIINDGSATNPYRLVLSAEQAGSSNSIIIDPAGNGTLLDFNNKIIEDAVAKTGNAFNGAVTAGGTYTGSGTANVVVEITSAGAIGAAGFRVSFDGGLTFGPSNEFTTGASPVAIGSGVEIAFAPDAAPVDFAVGDRFTIDAFDPELQSARDAIVVVDGIQVLRDNNAITDVIEGVTLNLTKVTTEAVQLSISNDNQNINGPIQAFVQAYNALIDEVNTLAAFNVETNVAQPLFGDLTVQSIRSTLQSIVTGGLGAGFSGFNSLTQIGIKSSSTDGKLTLDQAVLSDVIDNRFDDLIKLFAASGAGSNSEVEFLGATLDAQAGRYQLQITQAATQAAVSGAQAVDAGGIAADETLTFTIDGLEFDVLISAGATLAEAIARLNERFSAEGVALTAAETAEGSGVLRVSTVDYGAIAQFTVVSNQSGAGSDQLGIGTSPLDAHGQDVAGLINGQLADVSGQTLKGRAGSPAAGLSFTVTATTTGNKGYIDVSLGVAHKLQRVLRAYTDTTTGMLKTRIDGVNDSIEDLNDQIENLSDRVNREAERLRRQFIGLETLLAQAQSQSQFLSAQLTQISNLTLQNRGN